MITPEELQNLEREHRESLEASTSATARRNAAVRRAHRQGMRQNQIAEHMGLSAQRVGQILRASGAS